MLKSFSLLALMIVAVPAIAGSASSPATADAKAKDPKRKICEAVEETGSRLSSKRICMTAEQWEAQRLGFRAKKSSAASSPEGRGK
jgi:hypothetical protein